MNISEEIMVGRMKASYEIGNIRGKHDAEKHARIEAFAAIRRAAEVARRFDRNAASLRAFGESELADLDEARATGILHAIRAAIESEKHS